MRDFTVNKITMACTIISTSIIVWQQATGVPANWVTYLVTFVAGYGFGYSTRYFIARRREKERDEKVAAIEKERDEKVAAAEKERDEKVAAAERERDEAASRARAAESESARLSARLAELEDEERRKSEQAEEFRYNMFASLPAPEARLVAEIADKGRVHLPKGDPDRTEAANGLVRRGVAFVDESYLPRSAELTSGWQLLMNAHRDEFEAVRRHVEGGGGK